MIPTDLQDPVHVGQLIEHDAVGDIDKRRPAKAADDQDDCRVGADNAVTRGQSVNGAVTREKSVSDGQNRQEWRCK